MMARICCANPTDGGASPRRRRGGDAPRSFDAKMKTGATR